MSETSKQTRSGSLPPELSLDEVRVRISHSYKNPNVRDITQAVLRDGPQAFRIATLMEIINPRTQEFHHYSLKIDQIARSRHGWFAKPEKSVRLEGKEPDEIEKLFTFLEAIYTGKLKGQSGELHVVRSEDYKQLEELLKSIPNLADTDKIQIVKNVLTQLQGAESTIPEFVSAFQGGDGQIIRHIATAARIVDYSKALDTLKKLVADPNSKEQQFQELLELNPWMFGSEYSELLPRRNWTRDDRLDYMLRRTVDNYLEIIEIKTPLAESLFIHDEARDCYYPSSKLSPVIGQLTRYIEEVERHRDSILGHDGLDTLKIRARAIIGRDNRDHQAALRNLNAHLHRIEIITFDQLSCIAERVLSVFSEAEENGSDSLDDEDDIPF